MAPFNVVCCRIQQSRWGQRNNVSNFGIDEFEATGQGGGKTEGCARQKNATHTAFSRQSSPQATLVKHEGNRCANTSKLRLGQLQLFKPFTALPLRSGQYIFQLVLPAARVVAIRVNEHLFAALATALPISKSDWVVGIEFFRALAIGQKMIVHARVLTRPALPGTTLLFSSG